MQLSVATLNLTDGEDGAERSVILALLSNEPLVLAEVGVRPSGANTRFFRCHATIDALRRTFFCLGDAVDGGGCDEAIAHSGRDSGSLLRRRECADAAAS